MAGSSQAMTGNKMAPLPAPLTRKHLFEDLAADVLVGERRLMPPPAVVLHLFSCRDEAVGDRGKIRVGEVQAEDQPAGSDPAQRQPFGAQIILPQQVVTQR